MCVKIKKKRKTGNKKTRHILRKRVTFFLKLSFHLQASDVQEQLLEIQPKFKSNLLNGVTIFKDNLTEFLIEYKEK